MKKIATNLQDCYILEPKRFGDDRGYFESINKEQLEELGFKGIWQVSNSLSAKGIIRGLHFQRDPYCQAKVVRCHKGGVVDVVVDLRKDSKTYKKYTYVLLTPQNGRALYVPRGFAHGFLAIEDNTLFEYYVDNKYMPQYEDGIRWDSPEIGIDWKSIFKEYDITMPLLSKKDMIRYTLKKCNVNFYRKEPKFLITGYKGQLGFDIARELKNRGFTNYLAIDKEEMDITNREDVFKVVTSYNPDVIFHCAAWTQVDKAEDNEELVRKVNVDGTKNLVDASIKVGAKIIYMSTDYIFDGTKPLNESYIEEDKSGPIVVFGDKPNPMNVYGKTKYEGEQEVWRNDKHFICRISWVFGINGNNFIKTMLKLSRSRDTLNVVCDQVGSPTYTVDLARVLVEMAFSEKYGTYNVNNDGFCSWAEFAEYIMEVGKRDTKINPVTTEEYLEMTNSKQAYRPRNSKLSKYKLTKHGFEMLPSWKDAVKRYIKELEDSNVMI